MDINEEAVQPQGVPQPPKEREASYLRRQKAKKRLIAIIVGLVVFGGGYWYFERSFSLPFQNIASLENSASNQIQKKISFSAPTPLVKSPIKFSSGKSNVLTRGGVITDTNVQRGDNDLPPLSENATLDAVATLRLDDMFEKQYFAHVAPDGGSAETIATSVGYKYLAFGENLALGNFGGDNGVVTAWMGSPGHRANILNTHYTQIGVAVRQGMFQGQNTWIAVQVFGRPASDCPAPDPNMKTAIDASEAQLSQMNDQLKVDKDAINTMQPQSGQAYNQKVGEYNALVAQYNALANQSKTEIGVYNAEVQAFNLCLGS